MQSETASITEQFYCKPINTASYAQKNDVSVSLICKTGGITIKQLLGLRNRRITIPSLYAQNFRIYTYSMEYKSSPKTTHPKRISSRLLAMGCRQFANLDFYVNSVQIISAHAISMSVLKYTLI